jgi:hypothetical protein
MLKLPPVPVTVVNSVEAPIPGPPDPAAYNEMEAPTTGCCPPNTRPEIAAPLATEGEVEDTPHPAVSRQQAAESAQTSTRVAGNMEHWIMMEVPA